MEYKELINKCKEAIKQFDLEKALEYWIEIHYKASIMFRTYEKNPDELYKAYKEFNDYMTQLTDEEVYAITDYAKEKYECTEEYISPKEIIDEFIGK